MSWTELVASALAHIAISLAGPVVNTFRRLTASPAERILRSSGRHDIRLVFSSVPREPTSSEEKEHPEFNYLAGTNEVEFAWALYPVFKKLLPLGKRLLPIAFSNQMYEFGGTVKTANEQMWQSNLFVSGSTKFNEVTRELHRRHTDFSPRIVFPQDGGSISDTKHKTHHVAQREDRGIAYDYGVIARYPNPYDPQKTVFLIGGVESVFQLGVTRTLIDRKASKLLLKELKAKMRGRLPRYFEALLRAPAHGLEYTGPLEVLSAYPIEPS